MDDETAISNRKRRGSIVSHTDSVPLTASTAVYSTTTLSYSNLQHLRLPNGLEFIGQTTSDEPKLPHGLGVCKFGRKQQHEYYSKNQEVQELQMSSGLFIGEWRCSDVTDTLKLSMGTILFDVNGARYEGEVEVSLGDKPTAKGFGQQVARDGTMICGEFSDNELNGLGLRMDGISGQIYLGTFKEGKFDGLGTCYFPNGDVYSGEFSNNSMNGYGEYLFYNGHHTETYSGLWAKDKLIRAISEGSDSYDMLINKKRKTEKFSEKALKIYAVFNKSIARKVASIRTKVIKMMLYLKKKYINDENDVPQIITNLLENKIYQIGSYKTVPTLNELKAMITEAASKKKLRYENEPPPLDSSITKHLIDTKPVSLPRLSPIHRRIEETRSLSPRVNDFNLINRDLEKKQQSHSIPHKIGEYSSRAKSIEESRGSLDFDDRFTQDLTVNESVMTARTEENFSAGKKASSTGVSPLPTDVSLTSFASPGISERSEEEGQVTDVLASLFPSAREPVALKTSSPVEEVPQKPGKSSTVDVSNNQSTEPNLPLPSKQDIPSRPVLASVASGDNYFTYTVRNKEISSDKVAVTSSDEIDEPALKNKDLRKKVHGIRSYINSKFANRSTTAIKKNVDASPRPVSRQQSGEFNQSQDVAWTDIYAEALRAGRIPKDADSEIESRQGLTRRIVEYEEYIKSERQKQKRRDILLQKTLQGLPSGKKQELGDETVQDVETEISFTGVSQAQSQPLLDAHQLNEQRQRQYYQTANLSAEEYIRLKRTGSLKSLETQSIRSPKSSPLDYDHEKLEKSGKYGRILPPKEPPPPLEPFHQLDPNLKKHEHTFGRLRLNETPTVRLLFSKEPLPAPPKVKFPSPPKRPPFPPSGKPLPPKSKPNPPKRPPYPPPI